MPKVARVGKYSWIKVVDIMTEEPLRVRPSDAVGEADELMSENKIRQLPVVQGNELVGIITDRDIRSFLSGSELLTWEARETARQTAVREIMTPEPLTISPDDDLRVVLELLISEKIGGIPVVDEAAGLVGIVTYIDVLRCFLDRLQED